MKCELFRKFLHIICTFFIIVLVNMFDIWYNAVFAMIVFIIIVYPLLTLAERFPKYGDFFSERRKGEVKMSTVLLTVMVIVLITVFWGLLGPDWKYTIDVAILAWGFGDAAAAIVGKGFGRHFMKHRLIEGKKTVEGTHAMFTASFLVIFVTTMLYGVYPWYLCLIIALAIAPVCAIVELISHRGIDTVTVPLSAAFSTFIIVSLISLLGV